VAVGLGREQRSGVIPQVGAGPPHFLGTTSASPLPLLDALLRGMAAAGQGSQAICLYLGLARIALEDHLAVLGVPTPHDRPPRSGGKRPWSLPDTIRLIAWRMAGVHPESIARRLGRSVGSIRSKCRRLGIPAPSRKALRRLDPADLPDVRVDWWRTGLTLQPVTPVGKCGTAAGPASIAGSAFGPPMEPPAGEAVARTGDGASQRRVPASRSAEAESARQTQSLGDLAPAVRDPSPKGLKRADGRSPRPPRATVQREMPLLRADTRGEAVVDAPVPQAKGVRESIIPRKEEEVDFADDLTWIGRSETAVQRDRISVWIIGMFFMAGLHWLEVARRVGIKTSVLKDLRWRLGIPRCDRHKMTTVFHEILARETCEDSGYVVKRCIRSGKFFWERLGSGVAMCPEERELLGLRDETFERRSPWVNVLTFADLDEMRRPARQSHPGIPFRSASHARQRTLFAERSVMVPAG
jgi:hypothetical protein